MSGRMCPLVTTAFQEALKEMGDARATCLRLPTFQREHLSWLFARLILIKFGRVLYTSWPTNTSTLARSRRLKVGSPMVSLTPRYGGSSLTSWSEKTTKENLSSRPSSARSTPELPARGAR